MSICPHCGMDTEKDIVTFERNVTKDALGRKHNWHEKTLVDGVMESRRHDRYFYEGESKDPSRINMRWFEPGGSIVKEIDTV